MVSLADPVPPLRRAGAPPHAPSSRRGVSCMTHAERTLSSPTASSMSDREGRRPRTRLRAAVPLSVSASDGGNTETESPKRTNTRPRTVGDAGGSRASRLTAAAGCDACSSTSRYLSQSTSALTPRPTTAAPVLSRGSLNGCRAAPAFVSGSISAALTSRNRVSPEAFNREPRTASPVSHCTTPKSYSEQFLIPAASPQFLGKLVVVLDLDETLVSSRDNYVIVRPGTELLLQTLKGNCELIVWTAGVREYALDVIRQIDPYLAIQHCIYRHPAWWNGETGCVKDLRKLGRPLDKIVFVDNTPDVFKANPKNSVLVSDFDGTGGATDRVLVTLADVFEQVFQRFSNPTAADFFASRRLKVRKIPMDNGDGTLDLNTVAEDVKVMSLPSRPSIFVSRFSMLRGYRYN